MSTVELHELLTSKGFLRKSTPIQTENEVEVEVEKAISKEVKKVVEGGSAVAKETRLRKELRDRERNKEKIVAKVAVTLTGTGTGVQEMKNNAEKLLNSTRETLS